MVSSSPDRDTVRRNNLFVSLDLFGMISLLWNKGQNREIFISQVMPPMTWQHPQSCSAYSRKCPFESEERRQTSLPCPSVGGKWDIPALIECGYDTGGFLATARELPQGQDQRQMMLLRAIRWPQVSKWKPTCSHSVESSTIKCRRERHRDDVCHLCSKDLPITRTSQASQ